MLKDGKILLGKAGEKEVFIEPALLNRHGLIAGATGTGKTVTLKVIAESLSELGVPSFIADVKGDLSGMIVPGDQNGIQDRLDSMGITDFEVRTYPVNFYDVYRKNGHPVRACVQNMDPVLLSRILDLSDAQQGILTVIFAVAEDMELGLYDLKDLQAMTMYVGEHSRELSSKYGNITKASAGVIQRKLLELEQQQGDLMFGMPELDINHMIDTKNGEGIMNILECQELFLHPALYSTFLMWILDKLYRELPEVGDLDKPKFVFFFDEAHLLFDNASRQLMEKIEQVVRLVRSKGVSVFFITQTPADIPNTVLAQLSNRIQHSLRAYTPSEIRTAELAAESFRDNPDLDEAELITNMKTGQALVSVLDAEGIPTIVEKTKILPPKSSMSIADPAEVQRAIENDTVFGIYEDDVDPDSAFEMMDDIYEEEEAEKAAAEEEKKQAKIAEAEAKAKAREEAKAQKQKEKESDWMGRLAKKTRTKAENEIVNVAARSAKKFLKNFFK